jgi:3-oxoacyl-[acyl-carrier-protein] synthase II
LDELLQPRDLKRTGRAVHLAIAAFARLCSAWRPRGYELAERQSWGVILTVTAGPLILSRNSIVFITAISCAKSALQRIEFDHRLAVERAVDPFRFRGPSHVISTGCTSSTDALGYAFNLIRFGLADHLVAGGADATISAIMQGFASCKRFRLRITTSRRGHRGRSTAAGTASFSARARGSWF